MFYVTLVYCFGNGVLQFCICVSQYCFAHNLINGIGQFCVLRSVLFVLVVLLW